MQSQSFREKKSVIIAIVARQQSKQQKKLNWEQKENKKNLISTKKRYPNNEVFKGSDNADLLVEGINLTGTHNSSSCQCSAIKKKALEY